MIGSAWSRNNSLCSGPCYTDATKVPPDRSTRNRPCGRRTERFQSRKTQRQTMRRQMSMLRHFGFRSETDLGRRAVSKPVAAFPPPCSMRNQLQQRARHCRAFRLALERRAPARVSHRANATSDIENLRVHRQFGVHDRHHGSPNHASMPRRHHCIISNIVRPSRFERSLVRSIIGPRFERSLVRSIIGPRASSVRSCAPSLGPDDRSLFMAIRSHISTATSARRRDVSYTIC
jgi:hypothetical protein